MISLRTAATGWTTFASRRAAARPSDPDRAPGPRTQPGERPRPRPGWSTPWPPRTWVAVSRSGGTAVGVAAGWAIGCGLWTRGTFKASLRCCAGGRLGRRLRRTRRLGGSRHHRRLWRRKPQLHRAGAGPLVRSAPGDRERQPGVNAHGEHHRDDICSARHGVSYGPACVLSANRLTPSALTTSTTCMTSP